MRQGYCYTCLAIGGYLGRVAKPLHRVILCVDLHLCFSSERFSLCPFSLYFAASLAEEETNPGRRETKNPRRRQGGNAQFGARHATGSLRQGATLSENVFRDAVTVFVFV